MKPQNTAYPFLIPRLYGASKSSPYRGADARYVFNIWGYILIFPDF